jgi:pSer/pThr/pTyr-binding forkhead associated (FHA) protein
VPPRPQPPRVEAAPQQISLPPATPSRAPGAGSIRGRLVVIAKDGGEGASYPFADRLDIGRIEGDVIVPDDPYISPRHARLSWKGKLLLRDLGTANGVYLRLAPQASGNGAAKGPEKDGSAGASAGNASVAMKLQDQDLILLGQQVIRFEVVRDAEEGLGPASQHGTLVFGTPAAPRYARLCLRTVEGVTRDVYYLGKRETILGRESGDIIFAEDPFLSRRHASIVVQDIANKRAFALSDFGSSNGTFLQIRGEVPLESGSEFRVGQQLFRVELNA